MHCKHCGNQIDNDSKFCSFCGGKVEAFGNDIPSSEYFTDSKSDSLSPMFEPNLTNKTNALLAIGLVNFSFTAFWIMLEIIARVQNNGFKIYADLAQLTKPLYIVNSVIILFLCFLFTKSKVHKFLFIILAICIFIYEVYETYIKTY